MNITQIQTKVEALVTHLDQDQFIYDLLLAYNLPKATITRLKTGSHNKSNVEGEIILKAKLNYKPISEGDVNKLAEQRAKELKHKERFVLVTDFKALAAIDTKTADKLYIAFEELPKYYDFFLPWAGMEKAQHHDENPADTKAAERMAKLFDIIKKDNPDDSPEFIHQLNIFLSRLLFCFFAEDTHIFEENQFTNAIDSHTQTDGSDVHTFLDLLFKVLNTPEKQRSETFHNKLPQYINAFPYVNGGLFQIDVPAPQFSRRSRIAMISSGGEGWDAINPDIFGSMFQAVIGDEQRSNLGQHYTSVPNIMKVIEPLFLNDLYEELDAAIKTQNLVSQQAKLDALLHRIHHLKIFDPACGSGNFLIIAYKELRLLEMKIFKAGNMMALSGIELSQFYGIEIDDFAGEIAKLALWLTEHQMNVAFRKEFGRTKPTLPLSEAGHIVPGNACRLDWEVVCPKSKDDELYVLGNPPYLGSTMQNNNQKDDMKLVFLGHKNFKNLDYISCWFKKGVEYIKGSNSNLAFVTTNSLSQGEQVLCFWPYVFANDIRINFAHTSFKWTNNAKSKAAVIVAIIGLGNLSNKPCYIYKGDRKHKVDSINAYLSAASNVIIGKRSHSLSDFQEMKYGNKPVDGGNLILSFEEKEDIINKHPEINRFIKRLVGSKEFIRGEERFCLWIKKEDLHNAQSFSEIYKRIENVRKMRLNSRDSGANKLALRPYQFRDFVDVKKNAIIVPRVSSERRAYVPIGFVNNDTIILDSAQAVYDPEPFSFGVIASKMHMVWLKTVAGRLKSDYRYSSVLVYNTFPFPNISTQRKNEITQSVMRILDEREKHSDKTLAQLYDPDKMPDGLCEAHRLNDIIIERCYRSAPFTSDEERLEYLFKLYEKMIAAEAADKASVAKGKKGGGK